MCIGPTIKSRRVDINRLIDDKARLCYQLYFALYPTILRIIFFTKLFRISIDQNIFLDSHLVLEDKHTAWLQPPNSLAIQFQGFVSVKEIHHTKDCDEIEPLRCIEVIKICINQLYMGFPSNKTAKLRIFFHRCDTTKLFDQGVNQQSSSSTQIQQMFGLTRETAYKINIESRKIW
ncbi:hypothetical protein ASD75_22650 [Acidovorax sp. Root568]|nr:hypothetical protein ASD75_22650 [Acidovorax sp. Root568]